MLTFGRILITISVIFGAFSFALMALVPQSRLNSMRFDPLSACLLAACGLISGAIIFGLGSVHYELQRLNDAMRGYGTKPMR